MCGVRSITLGPAENSIALCHICLARPISGQIKLYWAGWQIYWRHFQGLLRTTQLSATNTIRLVANLTGVSNLFLLQMQFINPAKCTIYNSTFTRNKNWQAQGQVPVQSSSPKPLKVKFKKQNLDLILNRRTAIWRTLGSLPCSRRTLSKTLLKSLSGSNPVCNQIHGLFHTGLSLSITSLVLIFYDIQNFLILN